MEQNEISVLQAEQHPRRAPRNVAPHFVKTITQRSARWHSNRPTVFDAGNIPADDLAILR
jgi:hypothetical protein